MGQPSPIGAAQVRPKMTMPVKLAKVLPDDLTPREALELVYELKALAGEKGAP